MSKRLFHTIASGVVIFIFLFIPLFSGCNANSTAQQKILNVGMLLGSGGLGDRSFNDSAYAGLLEAQKKYNIRFETINATNADANKEALRQLARKNYDLIMAVGFEHLDTIVTVAKEFPSIHFGAIDFEVKADNIASIQYREQEGDFLIGVLDAMLTKTGYVGVIGGTDIPAIRRIMSGFTQGVAYQDSSVKVFTDFTGTFSDDTVGYKMAMARYNEGADVIHNAASKCGLGIIQAAKETGKLTTGTSGDQRYMAPGNVVGNRPKRVDTAVLTLVDEVEKGTFKPATISLGLKENGISIGPFDEKIVTKDMMTKLDDLEQKIIKGQIVVKTE